MILGYIGIPILEASAIFQIMRLLKRKQAEDVSLLYFLSVLVGSFFLLLYFISIKDIIGITSYSVCITLQSILILLTLKYRGKIKWLQKIQLK